MEYPVSPIDVDIALQTYTIEELLELSECTVEDAVYFLVEQGYIKLPDPEPVS